ncbi:4-hydroxyphenylacetate isomerase [Salibacterium salarium]|uniref:4-hydroxyphenylacetate isomerase n=1 Tax=Salibacterium salarium TaxID=284579 RepID=A0A428N469_9BACI|nr:fumarylacetoacetate hydrolase family protein [Salibacterium salarium]RSL33126.1 4-hydroxyphenylacetate isomerase [Salibacterium salarium]
MATAKGIFNENMQPERLQVNPETNEISEESNRDINWRVPVEGTIYGAALNYQGELEELGSQLHEKPYNAPPKAPILYIKPVNTLNPHKHSIPMPKGEKELQVGASLGVVFSKTATKVEPESVWDYIEGFTIANDVSIPFESFHRPPIKQKTRDKFCPIGPWIVSKEDVAQPENLKIKVYINGEIKQTTSTHNVSRSIEQLVADVTEFMTLYEGDVLLTGTPEHPPLVQTGDKVQIKIENIGTLENTIQ